MFPSSGSVSIKLSYKRNIYLLPDMIQRKNRIFALDYFATCVKKSFNEIKSTHRLVHSLKLSPFKLENFNQKPLRLQESKRII